MSSWRLVTSGVPQGSVSELGLLNIFIDDIDSKFADDTKLSGAVDTVEGRNIIQRGMNSLEEWVHEKLLRFNKANYQALHLGQGNPRYLYRL